MEKLGYGKVPGTPGYEKLWGTSGYEKVLGMLGYENYREHRDMNKLSGTPEYENVPSTLLSANQDMKKAPGTPD